MHIQLSGGLIRFVVGKSSRQCITPFFEMTASHVARIEFYGTVEERLRTWTDYLRRAEIIGTTCESTLEDNHSRHAGKTSQFLCLRTYTSADSSQRLPGIVL